MQARFINNPYYLEYESLLKDLHRLISDGKGDTEEADAVRDRMDTPEQHLSREEINRLNGLSADLYMLQNDEVYEKYEGTQEQLRSQLADVWEHGDLEETLRLLRKGHDFLTLDRVAYLRAEAYKGLNHLDTALLFLEYAARLNKQNIAYQASMLDLLVNLGRLDEAATQARSYILNESLPSVLLFQSAAVLYLSTQELTSGEAKPIHQFIVQALGRAVVDGQPVADLPANMVAAVHLQLGYCYEELQQFQEALKAYDSAIANSPLNDEALIARGSLRATLGFNDGAISDFQQATTLNTQYAAPYFYLARHWLVKGDYERCLEASAKALGLTRNPRDGAVLWDWSAIAQFKLGRPRADVEKLFEHAMTLDPLNEQIQQNYRLFQVTTSPDATAAEFQVQSLPGFRSRSAEIDRIQMPYPLAA